MYATARSVRDRLAVQPPLPSHARHRLVRGVLVGICVAGLAAVFLAPALRAQSPAASPAPIAAPHDIAVETSARAMQPGELLVIRVSAPADTRLVTVSGFTQTTTALPGADGAWRALIGIDLDVKPGPHPLAVSVDGPGGTRLVTGELTVRPKQFPTRRLKVNPALVEPPPEALERIKRESEKTTAIYRTPMPALPDLAPFLRPVQEVANSRFGSRSIFNGTRTSPHAGADFLSGTGTPIKAPNQGQVRLAEDLYFSGNTVILDHGHGLYSLFAHLSAFKVREGDFVQRGDVVGLVGATGRVTGPHLHWALRVNGARVDPLSLLAVLGTNATATTAMRLPVH